MGADTREARSTEVEHRHLGVGGEHRREAVQFRRAPVRGHAFAVQSQACTGHGTERRRRDTRHRKHTAALAQQQATSDQALDCLAAEARLSYLPGRDEAVLGGCEGGDRAPPLGGHSYGDASDRVTTPRDRA
jgi:hypothetical protein